MWRAEIDFQVTGKRMEERGGTKQRNEMNPKEFPKSLLS